MESLIGESNGAGAPTTNQITGTLTGKYADISNTITGVYPAGTVLATMKSGNASGGTLTLVTADGGSTWTCTGGNVASKYRPQACR